MALEFGERTRRIPVYPAAAAVPTWVIARCVRVVLDTFTPPDDPLPATVRAGRNLVGIGAALREIHRPSSKEELYRARRRLKWDEALEQKVAALSPEQIAEAMREHIDLSKVSIVKAGNFAGSTK